MMRNPTTTMMDATTPTQPQLLPPPPLTNGTVVDASLTVDWNAEDGLLQVHSVVPNGIAIGHGPYGRCLMATKFFAKGTILYRGRSAIVANTEDGSQQETNLIDNKPTTTTITNKYEEDATLTETSVSSDSDHSRDSHANNNADHHNRKFWLHLYTAEGVQTERVVLDNNNSVLDVHEEHTTHRQYYGFDGFMNHSCHANTYSGHGTPVIDGQPYTLLCVRTKDALVYDTIATQDIHVGDELTCDYALFDYTCHGHEIPVCGCRAKRCRGSVTGFQGLSLPQQVALLHLAEPEIQTQFFHEHEVDVEVVELDSHDNTLPTGLTLVRSNSNHNDNVWNWSATQSFEPGQEIVAMSQLRPKVSMSSPTKTGILKLDHQYLLLDDMVVERSSNSHQVAWKLDTFLYHNHDHEQPNVQWNSDRNIIVAAGSIQPGDVLSLAKKL